MVKQQTNSKTEQMIYVIKQYSSDEFYNGRLLTATINCEQANEWCSTLNRKHAENVNFVIDSETNEPEYTLIDEVINVDNPYNYYDIEAIMLHTDKEATEESDFDAVAAEANFAFKLSAPEKETIKD